METPKSGNSSLLKGCLIAFAVFVVLCVAGGFILYRSVSSVVQDAVKEVDQEFKQQETALRATPADNITSTTVAELLAAFKSKPAEAKTKYTNQVLRLDGILSSKDNFTGQLPIKLPVDVLQMQAAPGKADSAALILCMYSQDQKARFAALTAQKPLTVLARLELDE